MRSAGVAQTKVESARRPGDGKDPAWGCCGYCGDCLDCGDCQEKERVGAGKISVHSFEKVAADGLKVE